MSKQTYLARYSFIIERLERGPATYNELARYLEIKSETTGDDFNISKRTLQRDIKDIFLQMGYDIQNERTGDKRYKIVNKPEDTDRASRLLESYQLSYIINNSDRYSDYVFLESRQAKGIDNFYGLLHAIINKFAVNFTYSKFTDDSESQRSVHPLALKEAIGRWYLVGVDVKDGHFKTFGLDRISLIEFDKKPYKEKYNYNIKELFRDAFGIINDPTMKPEKVKLSFTYQQGKYVQAYPLHHSQKVIVDDADKDEVQVELCLVVAYDFIKEILSFGSDVKVVSPAWLKKEIKKVAGKVKELY